MNPTIDGNKINGQVIAKVYEEEVKYNLSQTLEKVEKNRPGFIVPEPILIDFCDGADPEATKYLNRKRDKAEELGIDFKMVFINPDSTFDEVSDKIQQFNQTDRVHGIMVQLPLPAHLRDRTEELLSLITPQKDVDGLTEAGRKIYLPATIEGVKQMLAARYTEIEDKVVAVVGSEGMIGRPLVEMLESQKPQQLIKIDQKIFGPTLEEDLKSADVVFSATGSKGLIKAAMLKPGVIIYDIGLGDLDPDVYGVAEEYTPVIGGVGPNTVIALMRNLVKAYQDQVSQAFSVV